MPELPARAAAIRHDPADLIAELKAETNAAQAARMAAENANRAKSQFFAAASHDLRQPLHALGLFAAALSLRSRDAALRPLVSSINASVEALERLFAQLLDLSRLEAGALQATVDDIALDTLLDQVAADFGPQAEASGLRLVVRPTRLRVRSDPALLQRILRNLVGNALRYTETGSVLVGARRRGTEVRIDVVDTGVGIAVGDRQRVFGDFVQLQAMPRHHVGGRGMGLGLAIVRRLADLLGHRLELASVIGRGSRFSIALPRADTKREDAQLPGAAAQDCSRPTPALAGKCVVAIDDDPAVLAAMRALLESRGGTVIAGEDCDRIGSALRRERIDRVDLIVADLRLAGGRCGLAEIARLRAITGSSTPALVVSGDISNEARAEAAGHRVTLLSKPLVAAALEEAAVEAMALRG